MDAGVIAQPMRMNNANMFKLFLRKRYGQIGSVARLLDLGADPNAKTRLGGDTPLHYAVMFAHPNIARKRLIYGADAKKDNVESKSAVDFANDHVYDGIEEMRTLLADSVNGG